ncbi:MAG: rRNA maturation RNase YbeY [Chitinophagaceae bacterium]
MSLKTEIFFFFPNTNISLANRTNLKKFIGYIFKQENKKILFLNCIFCTDSDLLKKNRKYLKHDFYTDIITFRLSEKGPIQAEIYISIDRVRINAIKLGVSVKSELYRVIFHGVLHLCEYRDKTNVEKVTMRKKEDFYLSLYQN